MGRPIDGCRMARTLFRTFFCLVLIDLAIIFKYMIYFSERTMVAVYTTKVDMIWIVRIVLSVFAGREDKE